MAINPLFNAKFYLAHNADLIRAGLHTDEQLWDHYVQFGAQESLLLGAIELAARAPNAWFDLDYYLAANPDLIANGVTAGTALDHFLNFGIAEGREFNIALSLSDFDYDAYAEENADLREAFGIDADFTELTAEQKVALITHYLSFGYAEDREGVSEDFSDILAAKNIIDVVDEFGDVENTVGTIVDDEFRVAADLDGAILDGLGGNDTVVFNADTTDGTLRNIEEVVVNTAAVAFESAKLLDKIVVNEEDAVVEAAFVATAVAGSSDVLNLEINADNVSLETNGIETLNIDLASTVTTVGDLAADAAKGSTLTVNLTGGAVAGIELGEFDTAASVALTDLVFDATGLTGGFNGVTIIAAALNVPTITVKGSSAAKNDFSGIDGTFDVQLNTLRVEAGSKGDTFEATAAIDVFVAGRGADTFAFATGSGEVRLDAKGEKIVAFDTIENFGKGDSITGTGAQAIDTSSIFTTQEAFDAFLQDATSDVGSVVQFGNDSYVLIAATTAAGTFTGVEVVKIAGVGVEQLAVDAAAGTITLA